MQPVEQQLCRQYPSDVTDAQWGLLAPWFGPRARQPGRKAVVSRRRIVNAIFSVLREGGRWRSLPHDYPDWRLVYFYFHHWHQ
jgi:putative transposase